MKKLQGIFATVRNESPFLYWSVIVTLAAAVVSTVGLLIDNRTLLGVNVWLKPLKFAISGSIFTLTVGYIIRLYPYSRLKKNIINNTVAVTMIIDVGIIVFQGARGVRSHYNQSTLLDGLLFAAMGIFIGINVLIMVLFIIDTIRLKLATTKPMQWAILIGWVIVFAGSWVGGQMISQLSHTVGVADGGAGLPLVNWSSIAGDLRIAHFFGLHGIQIIPFFALWVAQKWNISNVKQIAVVTIFGLLYAAWIGFTFYQAKQGIALISTL
jgi:hypothetical protein